MPPELIAAVKERIALGYTKEAIYDELRAAGYDDAAMDAAYLAATTPTPAAPTPPTPGETGVPETAPAETATATPQSLIGVGALVKQAWPLCKQKFGTFVVAGLILTVFMVAWMFLTLATVFGGFSALDNPTDLVERFSSAEVIGLLVLWQVILMIVFRVVSFSVIRNLVASGSNEKFMSSLSWTFSHIVPVVLLGFFMQLAVRGGLILLIIPGIALLIYVMFSSFVYAAEEKRGVSAMIRSTELVYGHWWGILGRMIVVLLMAWLIMVGALIALTLVGVVASMVLPEAVGAVVAGILAALGFWAVMALGMGYVVSADTILFRSLQAASPVQVFTEKRKQTLTTLYWIAIVIGLIAVAAEFAMSPEPDKEWIEEFEAAQMMETDETTDAKDRAEELRLEQQQMEGTPAQ